MLYLDYDQAGLDAQYQLRERHPEFQTYFDAWDTRSRAIRERLDCRLDLRCSECAKWNGLPILDPPSSMDK